MKKFLLVLTVFAVIFATSSFLLSCPGGSGGSGHKHEDVSVSANPEHKHQTQKENVQEKVIYTCPMHPEVVSDKPGKCPKCGMNLEPKKTESKVKFFEESEYICCSMCPDVKESKPGKCPKCGMKLVKSSKLFSYICPEKKCDYKSGEPGKCPKHKKELKKTEVELFCPHHTDKKLQVKDGKIYYELKKGELEKVKNIKGHPQPEEVDGKFYIFLKPEDVVIKKVERKK